MLCSCNSDFSYLHRHLNETVTSLTTVTESQWSNEFPQLRSSSCDPWTCNLSTTLELVRNVNSCLTPKTYGMRDSGGPALCARTSLRVIQMLKFKNQCPGASETVPGRRAVQSINIYQGPPARPAWRSCPGREPGRLHPPRCAATAGRQALMK